MNDYASRSNLLEMCLPLPCHPKAATPSHQQRSFPFAADVQSELDRVSQALTGRIRQLAKRYAKPLPILTGEVATLAARVDEHLKKMGAVWK